MINLADYEKLDTGRGTGADYIRFKETGETRYIRFMYESGGENMGSDVEFRRKFWDDEKKKYVYDTPEGQLVCALDCIEYDADGSNPRRVLWERSAYFCKTVLLPMWRNYPRIVDGVWKITATNPKTMDATYALFPVMSADTVKFPIIEAEQKPKKQEQATTSSKVEQPVQEGPKPKKKYWE